MLCGHDHSTIFRDPRVLLFGIFYPAICITCILGLAWRIRRGQRRKYMLLEGQMNPPSEKSGGEQSSGAASEDIFCSAHTPHENTPLPSACDILQPLSHSSPLPSSGYLADVISYERRNRMEQAYQQDSQSIQPTGSPSTSSDDSPSVASRTNRSDRSPSGIESSPTRADDSSQATSPPTERGAGTDDQGVLSSRDCAEIQSVQKRTQHVEYLHDADEEGTRTWKRCRHDHGLFDSWTKRYLAYKQT
ncbi:hypothetical protein BJX99DRAFT_60573 [Aspergillus californicus]